MTSFNEYIQRRYSLTMEQFEELSGDRQMNIEIQFDKQYPSDDTLLDC